MFSFKEVMQPIDAQEIAMGLWMGSMPPVGRTLTSSGFNVLVLCAMEHQPPLESFPGVDVARIYLDDNGMLPPREHVYQAFHLANRLTAAIRSGCCALVTCAQGRNRSGFVAALTLMRMTGCSGKCAVRTVQERRLSPFGTALTNPAFVRALETIPERPRQQRGLITTRSAAEENLGATS